MSNPFDQNPWKQSGAQPQEPPYGSAYESQGNPPYGSAYGNNAQQHTTPGMNLTGYNNAWAGESNKTEYTNNNAWSSPSQNAVQPQDAYQYTGTAYGNQNQQAGSAYSTTPVHQPVQNKPVTESVGPNTWEGEVYHTPNKWRFILRFVLLLASIGHLGFAAGARPYSGQDVPFYTSACFYYLFAVAILSIIWSLYHISFYCVRRITKKPKGKRSIMFAIDFLMALLWGIGVIIEVVKFRCTDGSKFCSFYNVSIFWGFLAFAGYILAICWDLYGGCASRRNK